jgi:hypothetical protein
MIEDFFAFATGVVDTGGKPLAANISANFRKKIETALMVYSGDWEKLIHEKNHKSKISGHCPFKASVSYFRFPSSLLGLGLIFQASSPCLASLCLC